MIKPCNHAPGFRSDCAFCMPAPLPPPDGSGFEVPPRRRMSEPQTDALTYALTMDHGDNPAAATLVAEVRRLRAESVSASALLDDAQEGEAKLRAELAESQAHVDLLVKVDLKRAVARADRYAAALARVEALGLHLDGCGANGTATVAGPCVAECPTATAKKAREET